MITRRWLAVGGLVICLSLLGLAACGGAATLPSANVMLPTTSTTLNPGLSLFWLEKTREAVNNDIELLQVQATIEAAPTNTYLAQVAATETQAVHFTETAVSAQQMTETQAAHHTTTAIAAQSLTETQAVFNTATAVAGVQQTQTATAQMFAASLQMTQTARAERMAERTEMFWTYGPPLLLVTLVFGLLVVGLRWWQIREKRERIIERENGGPLILMEQRRSLAPYLPQFLRWLAWLAETNTVLVDADKNVHPVTVVESGMAVSPPQAPIDVQERTTARQQQVALAMALSMENDMPVPAAGAPVIDHGQTFLPEQPGLLQLSGGEVVDGQWREEEPVKIAPLLDEVKSHLLEGGDGDG